VPKPRCDGAIGRTQPASRFSPKKAALADARAASKEEYGMEATPSNQTLLQSPPSD